jgi:hypothetical protein
MWPNIYSLFAEFWLYHQRNSYDQGRPAVPQKDHASCCQPPAKHKWDFFFLLTHFLFFFYTTTGYYIFTVFWPSDWRNSHDQGTPKAVFQKAHAFFSRSPAKQCNGKIMRNTVYASAQAPTDRHRSFLRDGLKSSTTSSTGQMHSSY